MARQLTEIVEDVFASTYGYAHCWGDINWRSPGCKYMEVSIDEDSFELPVFMFRTFYDLVNDGKDTEQEAIVAKLDYKGCIPRYKSLDRYMLDILRERFDSARLVKLEVKQKEDTFTYYGTRGAVFDEDFNPVMVCSWLIERCSVTSEAQECAGEFKYTYKLVRPILRIKPLVFTEKSNPMERYLSGKLIDASLINTFRVYTGGTFAQPADTRFSVKVEIDAIPFKVFSTDIPSVSTTNQQLLQLAADHIGEIMQ